jgi:3D (Asp-Asp-Asp) domain-containing protein
MKGIEKHNDFTGFKSILVFMVLAAIAITAGAALADDQPDPPLPAIGKWLTLQMRVTAYCPCEQCCGEWADGITANGHTISQGDRFVAADRRFGFGTQMLIPGYNNSDTVQVFDRGGAIYDNRLDVFFNTHQEALEWGVQYLDVKIYTADKSLTTND